MLKRKYKSLLIILSFFYCLRVNAFTKLPIDITEQTIISLSGYLQSGVVSSTDIVKAYLERIKQFDKDYNTIITINDKALEEARKLDEERQNGKVRSLLHGIPIVVKDNIDVYGMPTTAGASRLLDNYPNDDAFVIKKLKEAGAIIIAKTNMSQFAFYSSSSSSDFGTVKNSYNINYSSYGSSGGTASAVSLSFAPAGLGTDTNSSVRLPASANSLVGYRPTVGIFSRDGVIPYDIERDTVGTITRSVEDAVILTNVLKGYDENDSKSFIYEKSFDIKKSFNNITIGVPIDFYKGSRENFLVQNQETYDQITDLFQKYINNLKINGVNVVYLDTYYTDDASYFVESSYSGYLMCDSINNYLTGTTGTIRTFQELAYHYGVLDDYIGSCDTNRTLDKTNQLKATYREYIEKLYNKYNLDLIVYPSTKNKLLKVGETNINNLSSHASPTINFPSITIQMGYDKDGLPYGIEMMATSRNDAYLLEVANYFNDISNLYIKSSNIKNLYEVDDNNQKLLTLFQKRKEKNNRFFNKKWISKVKEYYSDFSSKSTSNYTKKLIKNYYISRLFTFIISLIIWLFSIVLALILILLIRKKILIFLKQKKRKLLKKYR